MAESILNPGKTIAVSSIITVTEGLNVLVAVYTDEGTDVGPGPVLTLEYQDINGEWSVVSTQPYGIITFNHTVQQLVISTPGKYRISRPNLQAWNYNVGIETYSFN